MKTIKVATFIDPDSKLHLSNIQAYTRFYNPTWDYCIEYDIEAESGKEAKKKAKERRLKEETERRSKNKKT